MQEGIVAFIVAYAFWVIAKRYAPKAVKRIVRNAIATILRKVGLHRMAGNIANTVDSSASCGDGCGTCNNCQPNSSSQSVQEFTISLDSVKRSAHR
jgi:hypothetical protein